MTYNQREVSVVGRDMRCEIYDWLGQTVQIYIDRPLGSAHPQCPDMIYPVNYGYIPDFIGGDGEEQDVYLLGIYEPVCKYTAKVIAVIRRHDDQEDKLVAAPEGMHFSQEQIRQMTYFQEQYFRSDIVID